MLALAALLCSDRPDMLPLPLLLASALALGSLFVAPVRATALTTAIAANERLCFYADVDKAGEKLGVRSSSLCTYPADPPSSSTLLYVTKQVPSCTLHSLPSGAIRRVL